MWRTIKRPGFFGRNRDKIIAGYNENYGEGQWQLLWQAVPSCSINGCYCAAPVLYDFLSACSSFYEYSYFVYLKDHSEMVDELCRYAECYDNAITNIKSGLDYSIQEAYSTHIQDIAVRNAMKRLGREFITGGGPLLQIRGGKINSGGTMDLSKALSPANVPYHSPKDIIQPSKAPSWSNKGTVEDFWQSNKVLQVWEEDPFKEFITTNPCNGEIL